MGGNGSPRFGTRPLALEGDAEYRVDRTCFADEVVIDFPSVAPAVDRMRRAFLVDERVKPTMATIRLSPREAKEGALVPLEVPVPCTCRACGGRGETWTEPCGCCKGSGAELRRHQLKVTVPAGVPHGTRLNFTVTPRHDQPTRIELRILVA